MSLSMWSGVFDQCRLEKFLWSMPGLSSITSKMRTCHLAGKITSGKACPMKLQLPYSILPHWKLPWGQSNGASFFANLLPFRSKRTKILSRFYFNDSWTSHRKRKKSFLVNLLQGPSPPCLLDHVGIVYGKTIADTHHFSEAENGILMRFG